MALTRFVGQVNCSRRVKTNAARYGLIMEEIAESLDTTIDSAETQAAKTLDWDAYEDFATDLINLLYDRATRLKRIRQERLINWDDE